MAGMTLEEYVDAYYGGTLGLSKRYGIQKADDPLTTADAAYFNTMYGAKVFNSLNNESDVFKLLPKQPWNSSGWRVLSKRTASASNAGVTEGGAFPDTDVPDLVELSASLKEVVSAWDLSTAASTLSRADDGLGDVEGFLRDNAATDHAYFIDQMLMKQADTLAGDNFESLDRIIGDTVEDGLDGTGSNIADGDLDIYGQDRSTTGSGDEWRDANVSTGTVSSDLATARVLSLDLLDSIIGDALENGAVYENLIFLTGYDTLEEWKQLIMSGTDNASWRFMMEAQSPKNQSGVKSEPGMNLDSRVGYYDSIPIFATQHAPKAALTNGTTGVGTGISNIYLMDLAGLHFKLAVPTTYVANEDLGVTQKLAREYAFITGGEVICTNFPTQGKVRDLEL